MKAYLDTGVIAKLYVPEPETPAVLALLKRLTPPVVLGPLHRLELMAAWHLKVFREEITRATATEAARDLESDIEAGVWLVPTIDHLAAFTLAERLCRAHSPALGTRTLDILHVATAITLGERNFVTTDVRQAALARAAKLKVTTP